MNPVHVFIGIGSNIEPERNVIAAVRSLYERVQIVALSTVYLNLAEGRPDQEPFYNCAVHIRTELSPEDLKFLLRGIETSLGRIRTADKCAARRIDLDILIYDDVVTTLSGSPIPDSSLPQKPFLAIPLAELAPDYALPGDTRRLSDIAAALTPHSMTPLPEITEVLNGVIFHE